ncbi:hypothetical protein Tco_0958372 [Tanacetum coccineum]
MIDDVKVLQDRENLMKDIQNFLRNFSRIPFGEIPKVLLVAWERFSEIKHAFTDKQYQQEDIQELISKLLEDVRNINEELSEYINFPNWNRPTFYNDDDEYTIIYRKPKVITPDLPIEEPDNSLSMEDEHLNTISETEKSSVENLIDFLPEEFVGELDLIDPILPGIDFDEDDFDEDDFEEGEIDIDIFFQIEEEILREKLLNINLLFDKIKALKLTPSIPFMLENPSFSPIPVVDNSDGDNVFLGNLLNEDPIPEYEHFTFDIEPDAPVINNFDELNEDECFDPGGGKIVVSQNVEDDDSFAFVIWIFLPYRTYLVGFHLLLHSTRDCPDFEDSRVHGTDIKEMDKIKAKMDKTEHEKERT